jgi:hypothetical protein
MSMTETHGAVTEAKSVRSQSGLQRAAGILQVAIWIYGGFILGILTHAWWSGDDGLVFWPWSLSFVAMLAGWLVLQRRATRAGRRADQFASS